jgi:hypothetical protein
MVRIGKVRLWKVLLASAILGVCAAFPVYVRMPEQCVLCRADRVEYRVAGISFPRCLREDGEFTRWYTTHRPPHTHIWRYAGSGCMVERNFFGLILSFSMMMPHPIQIMKPSEELKFVKYQNEAALSQFFADMASPDFEVQYRAFETAKKRLAEAK